MHGTHNMHNNHAVQLLPIQPYSSPQTHHKTYLHTTSVLDNGVKCHSNLKKNPAQYPLRIYVGQDR